MQPGGLGTTHVKPASRTSHTLPNDFGSSNESHRIDFKQTGPLIGSSHVGGVTVKVPGLVVVVAGHVVVLLISSHVPFAITIANRHLTSRLLRNSQRLANVFRAHTGEYTIGHIFGLSNK